MKKRICAYVAGTLAVVALTSGCSGVSESSHSGIKTNVRQISNQVSSVDADTFTAGLTAAVAQQNAAAFGVSATATDDAGTSGTDASLSADIDGDSSADDFTDSLTTKAESTYDTQTQLLSEDADATSDGGVTVDSIDVSAADTTTASGANGTTVITTTLQTTHHLADGPDWIDWIPYVLHVDDASGDVTSLSVHDDTWVANQDASAQDGTAVSTDEGAGSGADSTDIDSTDAPTTSGTSDAPSEDQTTSQPLTVSNAILAEPISLSSAARAKVVAYATKWANGRNPAYYDYGDGDCTNFVSQSMKAGGWADAGGYYRNDNVWFYTGLLVKNSWTWSGAQNFYNFATGSGRMKVLSSVYSLQAGDVLQYNINPNQAGNTDMNHSMVVTGRSGGEPLLTYHSDNHLNVPFSTVYSRVWGYSGTNKVLWYAESS